MDTAATGGIGISGIGSLQSSKKFDAILARFLEILSSRFEGDFSHLPASPQSQSWMLIHSLFLRHQPLPLNEALYFPIFNDKHLIGAIHYDGSDLSHAEQEQVLDLIDLVLGESLRSLTEAEDIKRLEDNLNSTTPPAGVVRIADFKKYRSKLSAVETSVEMVAEEPGYRAYPQHTPLKTHRRTLNASTLIECPKIDDAFKVALEMHEDSQRIAFFNYWDLPAETRNSTQELAALGALTVFVPNPHLLSPFEQDALKGLLRCGSEVAEGEECPVWLSATTIPYADLLKDRGIDQQLLKYLSMSFLRIQKSRENFLGPESLSELH